MAVSFKGARFPPEVLLMGIRWYLAYPLSPRHVEERMEERGVKVDHSTINRWVIKDSPQLEDAFHRRKCPVWVSWRMEETSLLVKGKWVYLSRAIEIRQITYLNNIGEQDHRGVKRVTRSMRGFKSFEAAQPTRTGIELIRMIQKGQMEGDEFEGLSAAEQFYALAS
jgi:transposase-like protein